VSPARRILVALSAAAAVAGAPGAAASTRTAAFAPIDPGVRASAMGGAFTAVGGEPSALYWNPAMLFFQEGRSLEASYEDLYTLALARRTFLTFGTKSVIEDPRYAGDRIEFHRDRETGAAWALGIESLFLDVGDEGYSELSLGGGGAWGYGDRLTVGVSVRALFVNSGIDEVSAIGYDLGLGIGWRFSSRTRLGIAAPHLLSRLFWKTDTDERLPLGAAVGWSAEVTRNLVVALESEWREGEGGGPHRLAAGGEWWVLPSRLAGRAGYRRVEGGLETIQEPTFGAALRWSSLRFDYAFLLGPELLGDTHRVGVIVGF
jgi:hypothetical protein